MIKNGYSINYSDIAYYNFFLRPASNKLSINIKPIDKEIANNAFKINSMKKSITILSVVLFMNFSFFIEYPFLIITL